MNEFIFKNKGQSKSFQKHRLVKDPIKKTLFLKFLLLAILISTNSQAQRVYRNGILHTDTLSKSGVAAPAGYKWSEIQNETGNTTESNINIGPSCTQTAFNLADDFTVPVGQTWNISKFSFFAFQLNATTQPFEGLYIKVYNGPPNAGGRVIFSNFNTTRITTFSDTKIYRIFNSLVPVPGSTPTTTHLIWKVSSNVTLNLSAGTYWIEWTIKAKNSRVLNAPTSTVKGQRTPWSASIPNAMQLRVGTNTWSTIVDAGNPSSAPDVNVEFPFEIEYTTACPNTVDVTNSINFNDVKAHVSITTADNISNTIPNSANVIFQAGNSIILNPGFKTSNDVIFTAKILDNCW